LGAIGFGAVLAVVISAPLRERVPSNVLLAACHAAYGLAALAVAWLPFGAAIPMLMLSGMSWLITLTTLNASAQLSLPQWVRARGLSIYLLVFTGAQAVGSYVFGLLATRTGLDHALIWSAILLGAATLTVPLLPLLPLPTGVTLGRSNAWPSPTVMFEPSSNDGPVLVTARYRVPPENLNPFVRAMGAVRQARLRTGGHSWQLYHSPEDPEIILERFTVLSWTEFQRQHTERWVDFDHDAFATAVSHTVESAPSMQYFIALRLPR
jgi:MFS family permease